MLIEFSVSNFRSFRERQTFQMTAAPRLGKKQNTIVPNVRGEKLPSLLKVAAIYGGNASGKTNLILALGTIEKLARRKPDAGAEDLPVKPFRFDPELREKPSVFEVHFIAGSVRYQFRVSVTPKRILEETLWSYPRGKECLLYSRVHTSDADRYSFGEGFEADTAVREVWRRLTGPKMLFISQAVANSSEDFKQLRVPFEWLVDGLFVLDDGPSQLRFLGSRKPKNKMWANDVCAFLQEVDVPVTAMRWETEDGKGKATISSTEEEKPQESEITLTHETRLGSAEFLLSEESSGTRNLIGFWLPWMLLSGRVGPAPEKFGLIIVDELDASLHPELVVNLVSRHISSGVQAQLIFTTHDTHLMSSKLLRRDQIWLTDRNADGATRLCSIHSFKGREGEDVEKRYFEGRYRGLPITRGGA